MPSWLEQFDASSQMYVDIGLAMAVGVGVGFVLYELFPHVSKNQGVFGKRIRFIYSTSIGLATCITLLLWFAKAW